MYITYLNFGQRGVPAPGQQSGHCTRHYSCFFLSFFLSEVFLPEGVVIGFKILAWAPNSRKYNDSKKLFGDPWGAIVKFLRFNKNNLVYSPESSYILLNLGQSEVRDISGATKEGLYFL